MDKSKFKIVLTTVIIIMIIILSVLISIFIVIQPAIWDCFVLGETPADIAATIGGISALVVQIACVIALYLTFKKQHESNNIQRELLENQKKANDDNMELHKEQIKSLQDQQKKLEHEIKSSIFKQLESDFNRIVMEIETKKISNQLLLFSFLDIKEKMRSSNIILDETLYFLSSFLSSLKFYIENVINAKITEEQTKYLMKRIKDFKDTNFDQNIYDKIENEWRDKYAIRNRYEDIDRLLLDHL